MTDPVEYEQKYVQSFYDQVAHHFDQTRYSTWPTTQEFITKISEQSRVLEVGCGNGKNLIFLQKLGKQVEIKGCDLCHCLCDIAQKKLGDKVEILEADQLKLPYADNRFDYVMSIAVIHHLSTVDRRLQAIRELLRVTESNGQVMIQVWALEQPNDSKRQFVTGDNIVPWNLKTKGQNDKRMDRYCHVFRKGELDNLVRQVGGCQILDSFYAKGNWAIVLKKL
jgi:ubiquinone/menaquinone biosynthesis C-methylase UbiE